MKPSAPPTLTPSVAANTGGTGGLVSATGAGDQGSSATVSPTIIIGAAVAATVVALLVIAATIWRCRASRSQHDAMRSLFLDFAFQKREDNMDLKFWQVYEDNKSGVVPSTDTRLSNAVSIDQSPR